MAILFNSAPDEKTAIARYRRHAAGYDASARRTMPLRRRVISLLRLQPGDAVLKMRVAGREDLEQRFSAVCRRLAFDPE